LLDDLESHWPESAEKNQQTDFEMAFRSWLENQQKNVVDWQTIVPDWISSNSQHLIKGHDGGVFAFGYTTKSNTYTLKFPAANFPIRSFRLEVLADQRLPGGGPGLTYFEGDKGERLLQRFPPKRLEAEFIRDVSLFSSNLLVSKMYGPPVRPPQPAGTAANYKKSQ